MWHSGVWGACGAPAARGRWRTGWGACDAPAVLRGACAALEVRRWMMGNVAVRGGRGTRENAEEGWAGRLGTRWLTEGVWLGDRVGTRVWGWLEGRCGAAACHHIHVADELHKRAYARIELRRRQRPIDRTRTAHAAAAAAARRRAAVVAKDEGVLTRDGLKVTVGACPLVPRLVLELLGVVGDRLAQAHRPAQRGLVRAFLAHAAPAAVRGCGD
eukprot:6958308-Prymnesium_polylepis.1